MSTPIKLVTLSGAADLPSEILLNQLLVSFGRSTNNILSLDDSKVSRYHGEFAMEEGICFVRDLGSTNGIQVNGLRVESAQLAVGDIVQIGDTRFRVDEAGEGSAPVDGEAAPSIPGQRPFEQPAASDGAAPQMSPQANLVESTLTNIKRPPRDESSNTTMISRTGLAGGLAALAAPPPVSPPTQVGLPQSPASEPTLVRAAPAPAPAPAAHRVTNSTGLLEPAHGLRDAVAVAGWETLRGWLAARWLAHSPAGQRYALPVPRCLTVIAPQGFGKTQVWRHIAASHELEATRLELGNLVLAPPSTWVDAVCDALDTVDGARKTLVVLDDFDSILSRLAALSDLAKAAAGAIDELVVRWLTGRGADPFVVITATNPQQLHPELLRRGQCVSEVFWLDLPDASERAALLDIVLARHDVTTRKLDLDVVARATDGFSPAQLKFMVEDALFAALAEQRDLATEHLVHVAAGVHGAAEALGADLLELRRWARTGARVAGKPLER